MFRVCGSDREVARVFREAVVGQQLSDRARFSRGDRVVLSTRRAHFESARRRWQGRPLPAVRLHRSQVLGETKTLQRYVYMYFMLCFLCRDHKLQRYINLISRTMDCFNMYEERSFLRDKTMLRYVIQLLDSLNEFNIVLERSLVSGVE